MSETQVAYDTVTPAAVLVRHQPAMIGGHTAGCVWCLGTRPFPCDAYVLARQLESLAAQLLNQGDTGI